MPLGGSSQGPDYTVVRGDSLSVIGKRTQNSVAQLREWNDISGDLIEVGQVLAVGPPSQADRWTLAQRLTESVAPLWSRVASGWLAADTPTGHRSTDQDMSDSPTTKTTTRSPRTVRTKAAASQTEPRGSDPSTDRQGDAAEPTWSSLQMPDAKTCLGAEVGIEEGSFGRSQGLEPDQVSAATRAFQRQTLRCYQGREHAEGEVLIKLVVGCDGLVRDSQVTRDDTEAPGFAECVADVMRYAAFPAHARDEVELVVPMRFVADTGAR